jgi:hypothetical protein
MLPKTQPISEETKGPFGSTDTTNRTFFGFGARRNIVVIVVLLGLVANSLVSNTYSGCLHMFPILLLDRTK